jgi:hypothetical protein
VDNNFTVGFDPKATSALSAITIPATVDPSGATRRGRSRGG